MFGLSATKILLLLLVVGAVVVGTRVAGRIARDKANGGKPPTPANESDAEATELTACKICGTFQSPSQSVDCGKAGCPYAA